MSCCRSNPRLYQAGAGVRLGICALVTAAVGFSTLRVSLGSDLPERKYLPQDTVAAFALKPAQLIQWGPIKELQTLGLLTERDLSLLRDILNIKDLPNIERIVVAYDQKAINRLAVASGMDAGGPKPVETPDYNHPMERIARAFSVYEGTHGRFPRSNGDGAGDSTGLSWRVHLLPYLGEQENDLYKKFRLDEPWDSKNNKKLLRMMPAVYAVEGLKIPGKTSIHVLSGEETAFPDKAIKGHLLQEIKDEYGFTILAVQAAPSTAIEWTKPGGLPFDLKDSLACWGKPKKTPRYLAAAMANGRARFLLPQIPAEDFTPWVTISGHEVPTRQWLLGETDQTLPTIVVTFKFPVRSNRFAARQEYLANNKIIYGYNMGEWIDEPAVWPVTPGLTNTIVVTNAGTLSSRLKAGMIPSEGVLPLLTKLDAEADLSFVVDVLAQPALTKQLVKRFPLARGLANVESISQQVYVTAPEAGHVLLQTTVVCSSAAAAKTRTEDLEAGIKFVESIATGLAGTDVEADSKKLMADLSKNWKVEQNDNILTACLIAPSGIEGLPKLFDPLVRRSEEAAKEAEEKSKLKNLAIAFLNFHDIYTHFPSTSGRGGADDPKGLSWRVHLLPYIDHAPLHSKFHLDEPWDSPHNLKLVDQMPDLFKIPSVKEANKTSMHLLVGKGLPFDRDNAPGLRDIKDDPDKTIIVVQAGPDKAEIWTKPGGLEIDPKNALKSLGDISDKGILALFASGTVRRLPQDLSAAEFLNMIRHDDGK